MSGYRLRDGLDTGLHPDLVAEVAGALSLDEDTVARVLLMAKGWRLRQAADEARHARLRDDPGRLAEIKRGL